jgi:hypothetical protein
VNVVFIGGIDNQHAVWISSIHATGDWFCGIPRRAITGGRFNASPSDAVSSNGIRSNAQSPV